MYFNKYKKCKIMKNNIKLTTDEFIKRANIFHNNKFDYSKTQYKTMSDKICIICPEHGEFWQLPQNHLRYKYSCPECQKIEKYNKLCNEFETKARKIHGDKYDYSKVNYIDYQHKVCIICPEHGEFWQSPASHITYKCGCQKCANEQNGFNKRIGLDRFIEQANKKHNYKYDYSKFEYTTNATKSIIICPEHGEFLQAPNPHLNGEGCPKCGIKNGHDKQKMPINEYIEKCKKIHNNFYDYSKITKKDYDNYKICIICPEHGEFYQNRKKHLFGCQGCPDCKQSITETYIERKLIENNINYEKQKQFDWLKYKQHLKLDFYLPEYNAAIECQGIQHFVQTDYYDKGINDENEIGLKNFNLRQIRDDTKYNLCNEHNVKIFYYSSIRKDYRYVLYNDFDKMLNDIIKTNLTESI